MATSKQISDLVINKLESRLIYDYMKNNGLLNEDEVYIVEGDDCSVLYIAQSLTKEQKAQARINIEALGTSDIVSDEEFLAWLFEAKVVEPLMTASGEIYASNNNEIYVL